MTEPTHSEAPVDPDIVVRFGDAEVGPSVRELETHSSIYSLPEARFELVASTTSLEVDYLAPLVVGFQEGEDVYEVFNGSVVSAVPAEGKIRVSCSTGRLLEESLMGRFAGAFVSAPAVAHMAARAAGLSEDRIVIPDVENLPLQTFEVVCTVSGLDVAVPVRLGPARLLPGGSATALTDHIDDEGTGLIRDFVEAPAYVLVAVTDAVPARAEELGLRVMDWVLAWLTIRLRYGLIRLPSGRPQRFVRSRARAMPRRGNLVGIRGLSDGTRWVRETDTKPRIEPAQLSTLLDAGIPANPSFELRQAARAASRAATSSDPVERVTALWEAVEFLVKDVRPPKLLPPARRKALRATLLEVLPADQGDRVDQLIQLINDAPVLVKVRLLVEQDRIPFSNGDYLLLKNMRGLRNAAVHGGADDATPDPEELDHAVALVSRLLIYRQEAPRRPSTE